MDYLEIQANKILKKQKMKSVLRLMPINQEEDSDRFKQPQIDQIRKKLRLICHINNHSNLMDNNKQNSIKTYKKTGDLLSILLGQVKSKKKKQADLRKEEVKVNIKNMEGQRMLKPSIIALKHRKIKTESQQDRSQNQIVNLVNLNTLDFALEAKSYNKTSVNIKFQKRISDQKIVRKIRISQQLKQLRKQSLLKTEFNCSFVDSNFMDIIKQTIQLQNFGLNAPKQSLQENILGSTQNVMTTKTSQPDISRKISKKDIQFRVQRPKGSKKSLALIPIYSHRYKDFIQFISISNQLQTSLPSYPLKFYISKGNNDDLPRMLLKKRKWVETNKIEEANFVWSQRRQQNFYALMQEEALNQNSTQQQKNCKKKFYGFKCKCSNNIDQQKCFCGIKKLMNWKNGQFENAMYKICQSGKQKGWYKVSFGEDKIYTIESQKIKIHNHFTNHEQVAYKMLLFKNLKQFYTQKGTNPFEYIPLTYHIEKIGSTEWENFKKQNEIRLKQSNQVLWILKPGSNTNRGTGIKVSSDLAQIRDICSQKMKDHQSVIIQQYIMPLLYNKRKFDIRCYVLATIVNKKFKAYWYEQGYIRTSCKIFNPFNTQNKFIHLTNDAVQKNSSDYGKFEPGNKLSFEALSKYLQANHEGTSFKQNIYPQMINISKSAFEATYNKLHKKKKDFCFEVFGLDFMIDQNFKVWLIEINRNPCLETSTSLLARIISQMLENSFRIALDPILPPSETAIKDMDKKVADAFQENKFVLIFQKNIEQTSNPTPQQMFIATDFEQD